MRCVSRNVMPVADFAHCLSLKPFRAEIQVTKGDGANRERSAINAAEMSD